MSTLLILSSKPDPYFSYLIYETKFVVLILFTLVTNLSCSVFLQRHFLVYYYILVYLEKSLGTGVNLSISNLSTSAFKLARFVFDAKLLTSTCGTFLRSVFVA